MSSVDEIRIASPSQYSFEVLSCKDGSKTEEVKKGKNVRKAQENTGEHTNIIRDVIGPEEDAEGKRQRRNRNGKTLHVIERIKLHAIRTTFGLKVKGHDQDEGGQDSLDDRPQFVGENDHHSEKGFPDDNQRFPEDELLTEGSVYEAADFVDPAILVVSCNLLDNQECVSQRKTRL